MKKIKISSGKAKARELQKWVCSEVSKLTGIPWGKDLDIESREMGQSGVDVKLRGEVQELFPFSVECKRQESWNVHSWIKQAKDNRKEGTDWIIFARRSHEDSVVIMDAEAFFKMQQTIIGHYKECSM